MGLNLRRVFLSVILIVSGCSNIPSKHITPIDPCKNPVYSEEVGVSYFVRDEGQLGYAEFSIVGPTEQNVPGYVKPKDIVGKMITVACMASPGVFVVTIDGMRSKASVKEDTLRKLKSIKEQEGRDKKLRLANSLNLEKVKGLIGRFIWAVPGNDIQISGKTSGPTSRNTLPIEKFYFKGIETIEKETPLNDMVRLTLVGGDGEIFYQDIRAISFSPDRYWFLWWMNEDPRVTHRKWPKSIWDLIEKGKVKIGMTDEMVRLSKGAPDDINTTELRDLVSEQWVYKDSFGDAEYLYFENGYLEAVQN